MFERNNSTTGNNDPGVVARITGSDEHDIPEPLEHWSELDFADLVPSWG